MSERRPKTEWKDAVTAPVGMRCVVGGHFLNPCIAIKDGHDHWFDIATGWEISPQFWLCGLPPFPVDHDA